MQEEFWNQNLSGRKPYTWDAETFATEGTDSEKALMRLVNDRRLRGKQVLDLGCGTGRLSVLVAQMGAHVTAVDTAREAVEATNALAAFNGVEQRVEALQLNALHVDRLDRSFDLVMGKFVLHHVEPFPQFAAILSNVLAQNGRGIFFENNARNPLLMVARTYLTGRFGIPKYGDDEEHPLEPGEIDVLRRQFAWTKVYFPELVFFRMINAYFFQHKEKYRRLTDALIGLDDWLHEHYPPVRKYSYHQIVEFGK